MADIKFEEALKKLEKIVMDLEDGNLSLEASLAKYGEGVDLARICQRKLEHTRKKVEILIKSKDGKITLEPFEGEAPKKKPEKKEDRSLF